MPKSPLRLLKRRNRAAFDGRSSSERSPNGEVVRKPLYGGPWVGYPVRARTAKKEILVDTKTQSAHHWSGTDGPQCQHADDPKQGYVLAGPKMSRDLMAVESGSMPQTIFDLRTWEEFEEKLKELQEQAPDEHRPEPLPFLYRGQENACWPVKTTLERWSDGREMSFQHYYESIYRAKSEIESYTDKSWDIPDPPEVGRLTEHVELFASFTAKDFRHWGQVWSYMVHVRHHGFPSPFLDWTRSPYIAAFFAFRRPIKDVEKKVSILVYCEMLNPGDDHKVYSSNQPEIYIPPKQYFPTHRRHFLQQSEYTICVLNGEREWRFVPHERACGCGDPNIDCRLNRSTQHPY